MVKHSVNSEITPLKKITARQLSHERRPGQSPHLNCIKLVWQQMHHNHRMGWFFLFIERIQRMLNIFDYFTLQFEINPFSQVKWSIIKSFRHMKCIYADLFRQLELFLKIFDERVFFQCAALYSWSHGEGVELLLNRLSQLCMKSGKGGGIWYSKCYLWVLSKPQKS